MSFSWTWTVVEEGVLLESVKILIVGSGTGQVLYSAMDFEI